MMSSLIKYIYVIITILSMGYLVNSSENTTALNLLFIFIAAIGWPVIVAAVILTGVGL